ncbi:MAG: RNA polymerase sigma factor region1.1 domain-containing protein, partial [Bdellovibrionales bacterium]
MVSKSKKPAKSAAKAKPKAKAKPVPAKKPVAAKTKAPPPKAAVKSVPPAKTKEAAPSMAAKKPVVPVSPPPKVEMKPAKKQTVLDLKLDEPKPEDDKAEAPIIETAAEAIKKMIKKGKDRGYVTIDEINAALPQDK